MPNPKEDPRNAYQPGIIEHSPPRETTEDPQITIEGILESYLKPEDLSRPPSADWLTHRSQQIEIYGEDSIVALLPEGLAGYAAASASRVASVLRHGGFRTLQELVRANEEELLQTKGIGAQSIPLVSAMQRLAGERLLERNRPSD